MSLTMPRNKCCSSLLHTWKNNLNLNNYEKSQLAEDLEVLENQIHRLKKQHIRITVFGRVGVGKSSLLNALTGQDLFTTGIAHGSTRFSNGTFWKTPINKLKTIELIDTPGIDEVNKPTRTLLASQLTLSSDLILFVISSDITSIEIDALQSLINNHKPVLLILNRCDQWNPEEIKKVLRSIKSRLPMSAKNIFLEAVAAAPRQAILQTNGQIRSRECQPHVHAFKKRLLALLEDQGTILLTLNTLRQAEAFDNALKKCRFNRRKAEAQGLIGKFAALKASGVAVNPLLIFDLATGLALDTALVLQLSKLYGLKLKGQSARKLVQELSIQNSFLGGAQISIQFLLGLIQHILFFATPLTGGLSLAPAGPIAILQAAIAIYTTKLTGKLVAEALIKSDYVTGISPKSISKNLLYHNRNADRCLKNWCIAKYQKIQTINTLLP